MGIGGKMRSILPTARHYVECPACGAEFRTQAMYEQHYYQEHAQTRFNAK